MGQATVPTATEPMNPQSYLLKLLVPMELPEDSYPLEPLEPMKVEETKVTIAPKEMAEDSHEPTEENESTPPVWHSRRP